MIIFISPAKTFRKSNIKSSITPVFLNETQKIVTKLQKLSKNDIKTKMRVSDKVAMQTYDYYQSFNKDSQPAIYSYFGHQYRHIDIDSLDQNDLHYMHNHVYIMSGLYGLLRPLDLISFYRLEMQDKTLIDLYAFWSPKIDNHIKTHHKDEILINLASKEYGQIIDHLDQTYTIEFYQIKKGKKSIHSMEAKKLRGLILHYIIKHKISTLNDIKAITIDNYEFNQDLSKNKVITFTKDVSNEKITKINTQ